MEDKRIKIIIACFIIGVSSGASDFGFSNTIDMLLCVIGVMVLTIILCG